MTTATTLEREAATAFPAPAPPFSDFVGVPPTKHRSPREKSPRPRRRGRQLFALLALLAVSAIIALIATDTSGDAPATGVPTAVELEPAKDEAHPPRKDKPAAPSLFTDEDGVTSSGGLATACEPRPYWWPFICEATKP